MAVALLGSGDHQQSSGASHTITKPVQTVEGSVLFVVTSNFHAGRTWSGPAGWVPIRVGDNPNSISSFRKVATASEPSSYTFTFTGGNSPSSVSISVWGNVDTASPVGADVSYYSHASDSVSEVSPSIVVETDGAALVQYAGTSGNRAFSNSSGMSQLYDAMEASAGGSSLGVFYETGVSAGPSGTRTLASTSASVGVVLFSINAADSGPTLSTVSGSDSISITGTPSSTLSVHATSQDTDTIGATPSSVLDVQTHVNDHTQINSSTASSVNVVMVSSDTDSLSLEESSAVVETWRAISSEDNGQISLSAITDILASVVASDNSTISVSASSGVISPPSIRIAPNDRSCSAG